MGIRQQGSNHTPRRSARGRVHAALGTCRETRRSGRTHGRTALCHPLPSCRSINPRQRTIRFRGADVYALGARPGRWGRGQVGRLRGTLGRGLLGVLRPQALLRSRGRVPAGSGRCSCCRLTISSSCLAVQVTVRA